MVKNIWPNYYEFISKNIYMWQKYATECFDHNQNPEWSALIYVQENVKTFFFKEWLRYIDFTLIKIIEKDSSEIEDLPYYDLWKKKTNPLIVSLYAIFNSSEKIDDTILPIGSKNLWKKSRYRTEIKNKIENILLHW